MTINRLLAAAALSLATGFGFSSAPAVAAPIAIAPVASPAADMVETVQYRHREYRKRPHFKHRRGFYRDRNRAFYNGHRGYRHHRRGYRRHNGYYFPKSAFSIYIGPPRVIRRAPSRPYIANVGTLHVNWCQSKYRSYRPSDNTFQPYHGPRKRCRSPYAR